MILVYLFPITTIKMSILLSVDGSPWQPKMNDVCSAHFVGNIPSKNPNCPAYIPTLFPNTYKKKSINEMQQYDRHNRYRAKQRKCNTVIPFTMTINDSN